MNQGIACMIVIIGIFFFQFFYVRRLNRKILERKIDEKYGKNPSNQEHDFNKIEILWKKWFESTGEIIDDITWNDLELDKLFSRINNCSSFLGEQLLYVTLKMQGKNRIPLEDQENRIAYLNANEIQRKRIQMKLAQLGKSQGSYHTASFIDNSTLFKIQHEWI